MKKEGRDRMKQEGKDGREKGREKTKGICLPCDCFRFCFFPFYSPIIESR
jgi:hypothetical protein